MVSAITVRRDRYSFGELSAWRDSATSRLLGRVEGVTFTDLDEANNAVTIGIERRNRAMTEEVVRAALHGLGVPDSAVRVVYAEAVVQPRGLPSTITLFGGTAINGTTDTLSGGYKIVRGTVAQCTLGVIVKRFGVLYALTGSHCSTTIFGLDPTDGWEQNGMVFGHEAWDTTGTGTSRYSDAALVSTSAVPAAFGTIARTLVRAYNQSTTRTIDTSNPYLYVSSAATAAIQGLEVDKVGAMTGWTYGLVTNTCVDFNANGKTYRCQIRTSVWGSRGDSGASLWAWDGQDGATLYGVSYSGLSPSGSEVIDGTTVDVGSDSYFSSYGGFLNDIGSSGVSVVTGTTVSAPALSGSLSGTNPVLSWTQANVSNGDPSATRYYLYRETHTAGIGYTETETAIAPYYSSTTYLDLNRTVSSYTGTSRPAATKSFVGYRVGSYNRGATNTSQWVYFLTP